MNPLPVWLKIALAAIVLCGLWWRIEIYSHRTWSTDEYNQYKVETARLIPFWTKANYKEVYSFPGDYLLTYPFVQAFKTNRMAVAIPHLIATILGFYFLFLLGQRYLHHPISWLITFIIFAFNRELIFHALELRPYSVLATLGLACFYLMENLLNPQISLDSRQYPLYFIYLMLAIAFHPYGFIIIAFCSFYFLSKNYRLPGFFQKLKDNRVFWGLSLICGLGLWIYYSTSPYSLHIAEKAVFVYIPDPVHHTFGFIKSVVGNLVGNKICDLFLAGCMVRLFYPSRRHVICLFLFIFVLPILFIVYSDILFGYWFLQRQLIWLIALFPLFIGICWDGIFRHE